MHIDVKRLQEMGFVVECRGPKDSIESIDIWPRRDASKPLVDCLEREADLLPRYVDEVLETVHELQIIQAIRRT